MEDLRVEVRRAGIGGADLAARIEADHRSAPIAERWRMLLDHAVKLTSDPKGRGADDVAALRRAELTDEQIHDGVQVAAYFNYINRVASALGVDPEPERERAARRHA